MSALPIMLACGPYAEAGGPYAEAGVPPPFAAARITPPAPPAFFAHISRGQMGT